MQMLDKMQLTLQVAFFPFKDLFCSSNDELVEMAWQVHRQTKKSTACLNAFLEKLYPSIMSRCIPSSLDEINLLLEKFHPYLFRRYFRYDSLTREEMESLLYEYYFDLIQQFTRALMSHRDGEMVFKYWNHELRKQDEAMADIWQAYTEFDKVHMFSLLSRLLPLDLFVASYYASNHLFEPLQLDGLYQHINLADAPLHDVLRNGVSENHLHASAAFTFTMLWQTCMNFNGDFSHSQVGKYLKNFRVSFTCNSSEVKEYILTAQLLRYLLAHYIASAPTHSLSQWIRENLRQFQSVYQRLVFEDSSFATVEELKTALELVKKELPICKEGEVDWITAIFDEYRCIHTYGENIFLQQVMKFKEVHSDLNRADLNEFLHVFFRYLRIKNEFYQEVNQSNSVKGLDYFRSYFDRATDGFSSQEEHYFLNMLRNLFQNQYLKKVELRLSIAPRESKNRLKILNILRSYRQILAEDYLVDHNKEASFPRIGLVYHLIKQKDNIDKDWMEYRRDNSRLDRLHYGRIQQDYLDKTSMIMRLRNRIPYLSNFVVGLDAASLENHTPIQVFSPVFEVARNSDKDGMRMLDRDGHKVRHQSLFFTFHAGEDYRHLNSGLRRIDEVIDYCKFHSGDRVGHGIALGVSVERWVQENEQVLLPQGEYLDNLLWAWGVYTRASSYNFNTFSYLQHKIYKVLQNVLKDDFRHGMSIEMLYEVYQTRFKPIQDIVAPSSQQMAAAVRNNRVNRQFQFLLHMYHDKTYLERLMDPIFVRTTEIEREITLDMQRYVRHKVAHNGIVVEVNPSSNFAIGDIKSIYENQFFQIHQPDDRDVPNTLVSINTDDPIVFNTNISNEFAYLYYGMLYRGIGRSEALNWIETIRKSGMDTSFIRDDVSNYEYLRQLDCLLAALEDPHYCEES
ncbi:hypothetical protein CIG75_02580 [Tumebacillus algifaecis]|uniref:Uncharacterized protein n=1 Tax=Tumebacillus algifaecis TaxID=1214604 RepID=A0A223CXP6_9BACL|nr:hypothetical protein [Tumebacillus algifaecis]ASS73975.1 hypothetical protein CIG75_02580 [Tumebacillus algifaecis]